MASGHFGAGLVRAVRDVAADVRLVEIEPQRGVQRYQTGAHLDIAVVVDGLPDIRSYSLVGESPADGAYRIAVKDVRDGRGGSRFVRALETDHDVQISDPQSQFELQYGRPEYLLIAGGIGITPMIGMAQALERHGRPFRLLYAGRTRDQMPFVDDLRELLGERLELFVSAHGTRLDVGREIDRLDPEGEVYLCGPLRLRDAVQQAWQAQDRSAGRLQFETFASGGRFAPEEFVVRLADQQDHEVRVGRNRTLLGALQDNGVDMMWDCLRGECGLCAVRVLEIDTQIDHRDVFLSTEQHDGNEAIVTCVSRAVGGSLVIDTGFRQPSG